MSTRQENPGSGTARRVVLTIVIIGIVLAFMVLPWAFLFHSPEQFAGWAASGVFLAVAMHLFLSSRKRRQALEEMLEEEEEEEEEDDDAAP